MVHKAGDELALDGHLVRQHAEVVRELVVGGDDDACREGRGAVAVEEAEEGH